jgi:DNA-nicking Smr family endonuclease
MGDCIEKELFAKDTIKLGNSGEITKISKAIKNKQNMDCLDLHGCYVENAKKEVANFCTECIENKTKFAKIIHGKKNGDVAKIKSALNQWLKNLLDAGYILGVKSIIDTSGQSGALIVSFRTKS